MADQGRFKIFIDSGGFIALAHKDDVEHLKAVQYYKSVKNSAMFYTTNFIIAETYTWLRYHTSHSAAVKFLDIIEKSVSNNELVVIQVTPYVEEKARNILKKYTDQTFSFVDATSFVILELLEINDVFGFDSHYFVFGKTLHP